MLYIKPFFSLKTRVIFFPKINKLDLLEFEKDPINNGDIFGVFLFPDCSLQSERPEHALQRPGESHQPVLGIRDEVRARSTPWNPDGAPDAIRHGSTTTADVP